MGVGQIVDEAIALYRRNWRQFVVLTVLAVAVETITSYAYLVPSLAQAVADPAVWTQPRSGSLGIGYWVGSALTIFVEVLFTAALGSMAIACLGLDDPRSPRGHLQVALRKSGPLAIATLLFWLYLAVTFVLSSVLATVTLLGIAGFIPALNLLIWWTKPRRRTRFLRRVIVFTFPFGLLLDWYVRTQLYVQVMMLEQHGPKDALDRSSELVRGHWFSAAGVIFISGVIVTVLILAPIYVVQVVFGWVGLTRGFGDVPLWVLVLTQALALPLRVLVSPIVPIAGMLLVIALRNEREGSDLHARLTRLHGPTDALLTPALH